MVAAIQIERMSFRYGGSADAAATCVFSDLSLSFEYGELALVCGATGSGKSTLLKAINGLVPTFTGGKLSGSISSSASVGYVSQNPETSFVADRVCDEIVFGMEQLGFGRDEMQARLTSIAERLGLQNLLDSELTQLSSGQQQRVAIAAALAAGQRILLLDEPTSSLDAQAAAETIALLRELADSSLCVVVVEHRFERLLDVVDSITELTGDRVARRLTKADARASIADFAVDVARQPTPADNELLLSAENVSVKYREICAVNDANLKLHAGEIVGLFGPNGSGKSSLLWALQGSLATSSGAIWRADPEDLAFMPCPASDLLFLTTVDAELAESDCYAQVPAGTSAALLMRFVGEIDGQRHPRDLSAGQQLSLALAVQLAKGRRVLLLDEPTAGLDYRAKRELAQTLEALRAAGHGILVASHDETFLMATCTRMLTMDDGEVNQCALD